MWVEKTIISSDNSGKSYTGQTISVTIPLEAESDKNYIRPNEYQAADKLLYWTLNSDKANPDYIVIGECLEEISSVYTITDLKKNYRTASVQDVSDSTHQGILPAWKVSCI